jgi:hypothetical protein
VLIRLSAPEWAAKPWPPALVSLFASERVVKSSQVAQQEGRVLHSLALRVSRSCAEVAAGSTQVAATPPVTPAPVPAFRGLVDPQRVAAALHRVDPVLRKCVDGAGEGCTPPPPHPPTHTETLTLPLRTRMFTHSQPRYLTATPQPAAPLPPPRPRRWHRTLLAAEAERAVSTTGTPPLPQALRVGLVALVKAHLGLRMVKSKSTQCSDWATHRLSSKQLEYAALDAWASRQVCGRRPPPPPLPHALAFACLPPPQPAIVARCAAGTRCSPAVCVCCRQVLLAMLDAYLKLHGRDISTLGQAPRVLEALREMQAEAQKHGVWAGPKCGLLVHVCFCVFLHSLQTGLKA